MRLDQKKLRKFKPDFHVCLVETRSRVLAEQTRVTIPGSQENQQQLLVALGKVGDKGWAWVKKSFQFEG